MSKFNQEKVTVDELLQEISITIKDEIIANYEQVNGELLIKLSNGQKFCLTVKEI